MDFYAFSETLYGTYVSTCISMLTARLQLKFIGQFVHCVNSLYVDGEMKEMQKICFFQSFYI